MAGIPVSKTEVSALIVQVCEEIVDMMEELCLRKAD
jgi:hypothetical protein